jgi:hypothetical protein
VDIYNVTSGSWTAVTLSIPHHRIAATSSQNLVFFGGGWDFNTTYFDRVDIYNTLNGSWSTATLSQSRCCLAATSVGNLVLFGGGQNSNGPSNVVDVFDVTNNTWTTANLRVLSFSNEMKFTLSLSLSLSLSLKHKTQSTKCFIDLLTFLFVCLFVCFS